MLRNIDKWLPLFNSNWLSEKDLLFFMIANKNVRDAVSNKLLSEKALPWKEYTKKQQDDLKKYYSVRDYLIFNYIKHISKQSYNYKKVNTLVRQLAAPHYLLDKKHAQTSGQDTNENWQILHKASVPNDHFKGDAESEKIAEALLKNSVIVVTFDTDKIKLGQASGEYLKNSFQIAAEGGEFKQDWNYFYARVTTETLLYLPADTRELQRFTLHSALRPAYGSLQFYNCIAPIKNYGNSFLVLNPTMRFSATMTFSDSLERVQKEIVIPGILTQPHSLIQQFPPALKNACKTLAETGIFPKDFNFQYKQDHSQYIEVQLPPNIKLNNPEQVMHIHCDFDKHMPALSQIEKWIQNGMTVSMGKNPFEDLNYAEAYKNNKIKEFLLTLTIKYIHQAALLLGETDAKHLICERVENKLRFTFHVTHNQPHFHQAQAWLVLKLLGFLNIESKWPNPLQFSSKHNPFCYEVNCDSLTFRLADCLTRLFNTYLVSANNLTYFEKNKKTHPVFGKGATEESSHTRTLALIEGQVSCSLQTIWLYDQLFINVETKDQVLLNYSFRSIKQLFENATLCGQTISIQSSLAVILEKLADRFNYFATIIIDHKDRTDGNILLALRKNSWEKYALGFSTPGGHNNNPYHYLDVYTDNEFGAFTPKENFNNQLIIDKNSFPRMVYAIHSSQNLFTRQLDPIEFVEHSLDSIAFYELGNLNPEQLKSAATHFILSEEEYKKHFGNALALRPVNSVQIYLRHMANKIKSSLNNESKEAYVTIATNHEEKIHNCYHVQGKFWLPSKDFGHVTITDSKEHLAKYAFFLTKNDMEFIIKENAIVITRTNPQPLFSFIDTVIAMPKPSPLEMMQYAVSANTVFDYIKLITFPTTHYDIKSLLSFKAYSNEECRTVNKLPIDPLTQLLLEIPKKGINVTDKDGNTSLHLACQSNCSLSLISNLLKYKADLEIRNKKNQSIWFLALQNKRMAIINLLRIHEEQYTGSRIFPAILRDFMVKEAATSHNKCSVIDLVFQSNGMNDESIFDLCADYLIDKFSPGINLANGSGETPLHIAATYNYVQQVQTMLEANADANLVDKEGNTPLHSLLNKPLHFERDAKDVEDEKNIMTCLFRLGKANLNAQNKQGNTPLHFAFFNKKISHANYLLELKADPTIKNKAEEAAKASGLFFFKWTQPTGTTNSQNRPLSHHRTLN